MDEVQRMREGVAKEYGIALYRRYSEPEAAHILKIDLTTLKRMRRAGKTPYVALGERQIRYLGIHIVDLIAFGEKWRDINGENLSLGSGTSPNAEPPRRGTEHATTPTPKEPSASALLATILNKPFKP